VFAKLLTKFYLLWFFSCCYPDAETNKKSELMLIRHARAHSSSCSQVIFGLCPSILSHSIILQPKNRKNLQKNLFWSWRSFKITDFNSTKKQITSACYDE